jgi:hypothetical protein
MAFSLDLQSDRLLAALQIPPKSLWPAVTTADSRPAARTVAVSTASLLAGHNAERGLFSGNAPPKL